MTVAADPGAFGYALETLGFDRVVEHADDGWTGRHIISDRPADDVCVVTWPDDGHRVEIIWSPEHPGQTARGVEVRHRRLESAGPGPRRHRRRHRAAVGDPMTATLTVTAEQLGRAVDAVQDATGLSDGIEVLPDYSGRAMYGATYLGVTGGAGVAALLLLALAEETGTDHTELLAELALLDGWRRDSLGLDEPDLLARDPGGGLRAPPAGGCTPL